MVVPAGRAHRPKWPGARELDEQALLAAGQQQHAAQASSEAAGLYALKG